MPRFLCLTRQCLGLVTRIECIVRPLAGGQGRWTLICAAGLSGKQPTVVKAQGPFYGARGAESVLAAVAESLSRQGYAESDDPMIWRLHLQSELRKLNAPGERRIAGRQSHPTP